MRFMRDKMVTDDLAKAGITDQRILSAFHQVPRHYFVAEEYIMYSYDNESIPIGKKQWLNEAYTDAALLEILKLQPTDSVLEIGSGSGYLCAIMSYLVKEVYGVELLDLLYQKSKKIMEYFGYKNVMIVEGDGAHGFLEVAPFDVIIISCAMKDLPMKIVEQLAPNGRILVPLGDELEQEWTLFTLSQDSLKMRRLFKSYVKPMIEEE